MLAQLQLKKPAAGDIWPALSVQRIEWSSANIDNIKLESSLDSGRTWTVLLSSYPASATYYEWTVPEKTSDSCYIRISDVLDPSTSSSNYKNNPFKIPAPSISIDPLPNAVFAGTVLPISWVSSGIRKLNIYVSYDNKATYTKIADTVTGNYFYYNWIVPANYQTTCFVKLESASNTGLTAINESAFAIEALAKGRVDKFKGGAFDGHSVSSNAQRLLEITKPNTRDSVFGNTAYTISWKQNNLERVNLYYSIDNGANWMSIASSLAAGSGSYNWIMPTTATNQGLFKVEDAIDTSLNDKSDYPFVIKQKQLKITDPDINTVLYKNTAINISWNSGGVSLVKARIISTKPNQTLFDSIPANYESINKIISASLPDSFRVVLYDASDTSLTDTSVLLIPKKLATGSADKFHGGGFDGHTVGSNTKSTIKLLSPTGGEKISVLFNQTVRWRTENVERVSLDYSIDSGKNWNNAGENLTATANIYTWKTPNLPSAKCLVRVRNSMDSSLFAISDSVFTLLPKQLFNITDSLNWTIGMAKAIEWQAMGVDSVRIQYKTSAQQSWKTLKDSVPANLEAYNWILPNSLTDSLWIRIIDIADSTVKGEGAYFKKITKLTQSFSPVKFHGGSFDGHTQRSNINKVIVNRPAENEILVGGEMYTIRWTTVNFEDSILLQYSIDSGLTWVNITRTMANVGMYDWKIPFAVGGVVNGNIRTGNSVGIVKTAFTAGDGSINSTKCLIRALDITTDNQPLGISFKPFTITSNPALVKYDISFPKILDTAYSNGLLLKLLASNSQGKKPKFILVKGPVQLKSDSLLVTGPGTVSVGALILGDSIRTASDTVYQQFCINPIKPTISAKSAISFCVGDSVQLASSFKGSNQWYLNSISILGVSDSLLFVKQTGTFQASYLFDGCKSVLSNAINIIANALPTIPVISNNRPLSFAVGDSTVLTSSSLIGNQWYLGGVLINGATSQNLTVKTSGSYTLKVTNASGCSAMSTAVVVNANNIPGTLVISNNRALTFCEGDSTVLRSSIVTGNQWYLNGAIINGAVQQDLVVKATGLYTVVNNVQTSNAIAVTVNISPSIPVISNNRPLSFINGDSTILSSSSNELNQWLLNGNAISAGTGKSLVVYTAGSYTVRVVNASGCGSISLPVVVQVNQTILVPVISNKSSLQFCEGDSVVLSSTIAAGNQWYLNGSIIAGATSTNYTARLSGNYTVVNNGQLSNSLTVKANPLPSVPIISSSSAGFSFCSGDTIQLISSNSAGNQWYLNGVPLQGAIQNKLQVSIPGNFSVKTVSVDGCMSASATINTTVNALPAVPTISNSRPLSFNNGDSTVLSATQASAYQWLLNGLAINASNNKDLVVYTSGNYQVRVTNTSACSAISTVVNVQVSAVPNPVPKPIISNNRPLVFCVGDSTILTSSIATGNQWYKNGIAIVGATGQSLLVKASGSYTVATNAAGLSLGVTVLVNAIPDQPKIIRDINNNLVSSSITGNQWYADNQTILTGITQQFYKPLTVGYYSVNVTVNGCTSPMSDKYYYLVTALNNLSTDATIKLYPNPVKNQFTVNYQVQGVTKASIEITDEFGRKLMTIKNVKSGDQIDVSSLTGGVYFVKTYSDNGKLNNTTRILKL
ncbi:MAG: hypothetical protein CFE25_11625 [Chitinophagaceae bacterium BSSC1]|nr:MAG: hypothetical protein CFE25_11625 [Chitinophagaceae bacterium BSSC1]